MKKILSENKIWLIPIIIILLFIFLIFLGLFLSVNNNHSNKDSEDEKTESTFTNHNIEGIPKDRKIRADEIKKLFDKLSTDNHIHDLAYISAIHQNLGINSSLSLNDYRYHIRLENIELDNKVGNEKVIVISDKYLDDLQYLIFDKDGNFLDFVELLIQKPIPFKYRVVNKGDNNWIIIPQVLNSGTGLSIYVDQWFRLIDGKLKLVLEYPIEGHFSMWFCFEKGYSSEVISQSIVNNKFILNVNFKSKYYWLDGFRKGADVKYILFTDDNVYYVWDDKKDIFVIDKDKSQLTQKQIEGFYLDGEESFLRDYFSELSKIIHSGEDQREWMKLFLEECYDSDEKTRLLEEFDNVE